MQFKSDVDQFYDAGNLELCQNMYRHFLKRARADRDEAQDIAKSVDLRRLTDYKNISNDSRTATYKEAEKFDGKENNLSSHLHVNALYMSSGTVGICDSAQNASGDHSSKGIQAGPELLSESESQILARYRNLSEIETCLEPVIVGSADMRVSKTSKGGNGGDRTIATVPPRTIPQPCGRVANLVTTHLQQSPQIVVLTLKRWPSGAEINNLVAVLTEDLLAALEVPASRLRITDVNLPNHTASILLLHDSDANPNSSPTPVQLAAALAAQAAEPTSILMRGRVTAAVTRVGVPARNIGASKAAPSGSQSQLATNRSKGIDDFGKESVSQSSALWLVVVCALAAAVGLASTFNLLGTHQKVERAYHPVSMILTASPPSYSHLLLGDSASENPLVSAVLPLERNGSLNTTKTLVADSMESSQVRDGDNLQLDDATLISSIGLHDHSDHPSSSSSPVPDQLLESAPVSSLFAMAHVRKGAARADTAMMEEVVFAKVRQCLAPVPAQAAPTPVPPPRFSAAELQGVAEAVAALGHARAAAAAEEEAALKMFRTVLMGRPAFADVRATL